MPAVAILHQAKARFRIAGADVEAYQPGNAGRNDGRGGARIPACASRSYTRTQFLSSFPDGIFCYIHCLIVRPCLCARIGLLISGVDCMFEHRCCLAATSICSQEAAAGGDAREQSLCCRGATAQDRGAAAVGGLGLAARVTALKLGSPAALRNTRHETSCNRHGLEDSGHA